MDHPLLRRLKHGVLPGQRALLGLFQIWREPGIAEVYASCGVGFVVVDMEAGALSRPDVLHIVQALHGRDLSVIIRVPSHDQSAIEHALDVGAHGIMVPKVNDIVEARAVTAAAKFPPLGRRGVNPVRASGYFADVPGYMATANSVTLCLVQVETGQAVENAAAIAAVPGVDGLFLGMGDLAADFGQPGDVTGPKLDRARARVLSAARAQGRLAGAFSYSTNLAQSYMAEGFDFLAISNDVKLLRESVLRTINVLEPGHITVPA